MPFVTAARSSWSNRGSVPGRGSSIGISITSRSCPTRAIGRSPSQAALGRQRRVAVDRVRARPRDVLGRVQPVAHRQHSSDHAVPLPAVGWGVASQPDARMDVWRVAWHRARPGSLDGEPCHVRHDRTAANSRRVSASRSEVADEGSRESIRVTLHHRSVVRKGSSCV